MYTCQSQSPNSSHHPHHPCCFPPLVSIRLFSTSVSLFLPCKPVHLYHFSRFHIYALIYNICFSLSDLLHSVPIYTQSMYYRQAEEMPGSQGPSMPSLFFLILANHSPSRLCMYDCILTSVTTHDQMSPQCCQILPL